MIEVLSPDDTLAATRNRLRDYAGIGVRQLVLMDPEEYIAYRFEDGSLIEARMEAVQLPSGASVPFDSETIFSQLKKQRFDE